MPAFLDANSFFAESQIQTALAEIGRIQEEARGAVSEASGAGGITAEIVNGEVIVTDTRNFGDLAFEDPAANTPSVTTADPTTVPAQDAPAAYVEADIQTILNTLVAAINARDTLLIELKTDFNALLAALQTAGIQD